MYHHEEYDQESTKKYDEELSTTLVFVGFVVFLVVRALTLLTGWSVPRSPCLIHHPVSLLAPAGPQRKDSRSPPRPHPQRQQYYFRRCRPTVLPYTTAPVQAITYASLTASLFSTFLALMPPLFPSTLGGLTWPPRWSCQVSPRLVSPPTLSLSLQGKPRELPVSIPRSAHPPPHPPPCPNTPHFTFSSVIKGS